MAEIRFVSIEELTRRLGRILGEESLALERLERALRTRDDRLTEIAIESLDAYPEGVRAAVERALIDWLLGDLADQGAGLGRPH